MILRANKRDSILVTTILLPPPHMLLPSLRRNILDEENGSFPMCRVALNPLHMIAGGGQGTEKVSQTKGLSSVYLLLSEDFLKTLPLVPKCKMSLFPNITMYKQYCQNMKRSNSIVVKSLDSGTRLPGLKKPRLSVIGHMTLGKFGA